MRTLLLGAASLCAAGFLVNAAQSQEVWQTLPEPPPMPEAVESGMAPVNDIEMYYAVFGEGEPVLLIHGGLGNADVWGFQVPALAETHQVIVADSRGHGRRTSFCSGTYPGTRPIELCLTMIRSWAISVSWS
jgi:hypothetical protein